MVGPEKVRLGDLLISQGLLTEEQLKIVLDEQRRSGRRLGRVIAEAGFASEELIAKTLAQQLHGTFIDLRAFTPKPELASLLPEAVARRFRAMVLDSKDGRLLVGFTDPTDQSAFDEISRLLQREIQLAVVVESDLVLLMNRTYSRSGAEAETTAEEATAEQVEEQEVFDVYVSLPNPVEKQVLAKRLLDNVAIEADRLDEVVYHLNERRAAKIRSEVTRKIAEKVSEDCRRAGLQAEIRESLRLLDVSAAAEKVETIPCPGCGVLITPADNLKCPNCGLVVSKDDEGSEYFLKKKIEDQERARAQLENEKTRKSNEQLLKEEQERKLREDARAQLAIKKENDLRLQREKALRKRQQINRAIQISAGAVIALVLTFAAGRWFAMKDRPPPAPPVVAAVAPPPPSAADKAAAKAAENKPINYVGHVELAEGEVKLLDRDKKPRQVKTGDVINEGDSIVTGKGELHVKMRDDGFIAVRPNTDMQIVAYRAQGDEHDTGIFALARGSFRSVTGWVGKFNSAAYQVKTPTATIGVRGTDHEPLVIPADSKEGEPGTYDKVNAGSSYIENRLGRVDIPAGRAAFASDQPKGEKAVPHLLPAVPEVFKPTPNEKLIEPQHAAIQKTVEAKREEQRKNAEQYCRKD